MPASVCRLTTLHQLNMDNNRLTRLPDNCFRNLSNLEDLSLEFNRITKLQKNVFDGLDNIRRLDLADNLINNIDLQVPSNGIFHPHLGIAMSEYFEMR